MFRLRETEDFIQKNSWKISVSNSKPDNHVLLVIVATVFWFPLGIIAAIQAVEVDKH
ncbi:hypothetical protein CFREI_05345 [Corynebacterium freiburgense]|nr:hypothetical protein CFREI_05345 [Corynebacterium freiburgense]